MDNFELIKQGAEGRLYKGEYLGVPTIAKERFIKKYRHPSLDTQLTKERIKSECRAIMRCKCAGIRTPTLYLVDFDRRTIFMEYFARSETAKEFINRSESKSDSKSIERLAVDVGRILGKMHSNNIIHGDLTTSNILLVRNDNEESDYEIVFIDFGLSHVDSSAEDKGVDLYVLERALISSHATAKDIFNDILSSYKTSNKSGAKEVLCKYDEVQARGRKRTMVG